MTDQFNLTITKKDVKDIEKVLASAFELGTAKLRRGDILASAELQIPGINRYPTMPKRFIFNQISGTGNYKNLTYFEPQHFNRRTTMLPSRYKLRRLAPAEAKALKDKFQEYDKTNFVATMQTLSFTIGADPEQFVEDAQGNILPAFDYLQSKDATKKETNCYEFQGKLERIFWDGYQAEFNTPALTCLDYFSWSIYTAFKRLLQVSREYSPGAKLSSQTLVEIPWEHIESAQDEHVAFGCAPSLNVYGRQADGLDGRLINLRSTGGHIHLGWPTKIKHTTIMEGIKAMDEILGVACVSLLRHTDNPIRRQYYGMPGEYRVPFADTEGNSKRVEYRTLSNGWLFHPTTVYLVYDLARKAFLFGYNGLRKHWSASEDDTLSTIFDCDIEKAQAIMEKNKAIYIALFRSIYRPSGGPDDICETAYKAFYNGGEAMLKTPLDIEANWKLTTTSDYDYSQYRWLTQYPKVMKGEKI